MGNKEIRYIHPDIQYYIDYYENLGEVFITCEHCGKIFSSVDFNPNLFPDGPSTSSDLYCECQPRELRNPVRGYIWHPKDVDYFKEYNAPLMELVHSVHFTNLNSTITWFGPMLYFFARAIEAHRILEIGHAEGYTAHYLAHAVKDNGLRYQVKDGRYYGIDIAQTEKTRENLEREKLPVTILDLDSAKITPETFQDITFDMIFQDGAHDEEHVLYELETLYHQLRDKGKGYWIMHDVYGPAEESYHKILKMIPDKYNFQHCALWSSSYGLGVFRKMDNYDYEERFWRD